MPTRISHFQSSIGGLFDCLKQNQYGHILLQKLDAFDNYLMSHSTNVCYLALLLGMKLDRYLIEEHQRIFGKMQTGTGLSAFPELRKFPRRDIE